MAHDPAGPPGSTIHLQYFGQAEAKPASQFKVGDFVMWNTGTETQIVSIQPKGKQFLLWMEKDRDGKTWGPRTVKISRLVAIGVARHQAPRR